MRPLYKASLKRNSETWFLNEGDLSFFVSNNIVKRSKTFILPGEGVDTDFFSPVIDNNPEKAGFRFLMISRVLNNKGVNEYAVAAAMLKQKYPDVVCVLMGRYEPHGPDSVPVEKMEDWKNRRILSYQPHSLNVKEEIALANCVVLPSYAEGLSVSLMEAASMEKPLIASNVSGCRELIINNESGLLCEAGNAVDLFNKMEKIILLPPSVRNDMGKKGRLLIKENYDISIIKRIYTDKISAYC